MRVRAAIFHFLSESFTNRGNTLTDCAVQPCVSIVIHEVEECLSFLARERDDDQGTVLCVLVATAPTTVAAHGKSPRLQLRQVTLNRADREAEFIRKLSGCECGRCDLP